MTLLISLNTDWYLSALSLSERQLDSNSCPVPVRSSSFVVGPLQVGGRRRSILVLSSLHMFAAANLRVPLTLTNSDAAERTEFIESRLVRQICTHTLITACCYAVMW